MMADRVMEMSSSSIKNLFDLHRFQSQQEFPKILLYFPFGLILLLFRLTLCIFTWPIIMMLPKTSQFRNFLMKCVCVLFGVFVKPELSHRNERVKLLICNHISVLDHIIVGSVLTCSQIDNCSFFSEWDISSLFHFHADDSRNEIFSSVLNTLQNYINGSDVSVVIFPEGAMTNGKFGLLKFSTWPFALSFPIQPVVIKMSNISLISISPSVLGTSIWCDLLWLLFVPYTVFTLRVLPLMVKNEVESAEEFSKRVQTCMAASLNLIPTIYTVRDKDEYEKRLMALPVLTAEDMHPVQEQPWISNESSSEIIRMADQVKSILPDVPFPIIQRDLEITKSADVTILRILEGAVQYVPESISSLSTASTKNSSANSCTSSSSISPHGIKTEVMSPLAVALDMLQGQKVMCMGYLLPVISSLRQELLMKRQDPSIITCKPPATSLLSGLNERMRTFEDDKKLLLSSGLVPCIKFDWLSGTMKEQATEKLRLLFGLRFPDKESHSAEPKLAKGLKFLKLNLPENNQSLAVRQFNRFLSTEVTEETLECLKDFKFVKELLSSTTLVFLRVLPSKGYLVFRSMYCPVSEESLRIPLLRCSFFAKLTEDYKIT